jgi:bifunctional non-homologous end joining protein LigD
VVLNRDLAIPVTLVVFDLLRMDGTDLMERTFSERRDLLASLGLDAPGWATSESFDDANWCTRRFASMGSRALSQRRIQTATARASGAG